MSWFMNTCVLLFSLEQVKTNYIPMKAILKLKHWQLFLILFAIPFGIQIYAAISMINGRGPQFFFSVMPPVLVLTMTMYFCWFYIMGSALYELRPRGVKLSLTRFRLLMFVPVIYAVVVFGFLFLYISGNLSGADLRPGPWIPFVILPLHLFSMFCVLHTLYFLAKALKTAETQQEVRFGDFAGEFFMLWFFPVGIWIIQPRINKLFSQNAVQAY